MYLLGNGGSGLLAVLLGVLRSHFSKSYTSFSDRKISVLVRLLLCLAHPVLLNTHFYSDVEDFTTQILGRHLHKKLVGDAGKGCTYK